jgi:hypothetical protein
MSAKLIKFYKGIVLNKLHSHVNKETVTFTIGELDIFLKDYADVKGSSTKMTLEELKGLVEWSLYFANTVGLKIDYPQDKIDKMIELNID